VGVPPPTDPRFFEQSPPEQPGLLPAPVVLSEVRKDSGVDLVDTILIFVAAVCALIFSALVGTIVIYIAQYPRLPDPKAIASSALFVIPTEVAAYVIVVAFMALLVWIRHNQKLFEAVHWNMPRQGIALGALGVGAAMGMCSLVAENLLQRWTPKSLPIEEFFKNPSSGYLLAGFGILVAPLVEELFFRGFLYPALARWTGSITAIVITAAAFAALHGTQLAYAWAPLLVLFAVGTVLTVIRAAKGSVATCVIVHMGYNLVLFIILFLHTGGFRHMERV
jgi:membrane protease YdiL (CAAX protease family)